MSKIEWTGETWNPIVGCSIVSPGCTNCYAMRMAARMEAMGDAAVKAGRTVPGPHYAGTTRWVNGKPVWTGKVALAPDHILTAPLRRRTPTTYFVNSMSDLFHEDVPDEWIDRVFAFMALAGGASGADPHPRRPQHTFQVLTKRSARMHAYVDEVRRTWAKPGRGGSERIRSAMCTIKGVDEDDSSTGLDSWPLPNVWLGVSAEDQRRADERIPDLLATPAAVRFVSAEPLLGPIDFRGIWTHCPVHDFPGGFCVGPCPDRRRLDWSIVGGESGPGARPMHPDWARSIRDQCSQSGVAFFFKQWGEWEIASDENGRRNGYSGHMMPDTGEIFTWLGFNGRTANPSAHDVAKPAFAMAKVGKARAGRLLDGRTWDEMPRPVTTPSAEVVA